MKIKNISQMLFIVAIVVLLASPFMPMTLMVEDSDPWYIVPSSMIVFAGALFFWPTTYLATIMNLEIYGALHYAMMICYSASITYLVLRCKSHDAEIPAGQHAKRPNKSLHSTPPAADAASGVGEL